MGKHVFPKGLIILVQLILKEINMCCDGWDYTDEVDGECPDCGMETSEGVAVTGCNYSSVVCKTCGSAPCDLSC
jgi:hypothetical protein